MDKLSKISGQVDNCNDVEQLGRLLYDRAELYEERGEYRQAIEDLLRAHELAQSGGSISRQRIANIRSLIALSWMHLGEKENAIYWSLSAIDRATEDPGAWFIAGLISSFCELYELAVLALKKVVHLRPGDRAALLKLGECLREGGHLDESIEVLEGYVSVYPSDPQGLYELAWSTQLTLSLPDRRKLALKYYQLALAANPKESLREKIEEKIKDVSHAVG